MIEEKIQQAISILQEKGIDLWLTFVRETGVVEDPVLPLIAGAQFVWPAALIIARNGETVAIGGKIDAATTESIPGYKQTIIYDRSIKEPLLETLKKLQPAQIAINYSSNDYMADGLTHGLYLVLRDYLEATPFKERLVSSEEIVAALRGRKSPGEVERIRNAVAITETIWERVHHFLKPGLSEKEIAAFVKEQMKAFSVEAAWDEETCPSVYTGPETAGTHFGPTDRRTERGHVLNMDFGVKKDEYCSDMQRTWYLLREGETEAPEAVQKAFFAVRDAIQLAAKELRPGVVCWQVDQVAREHITGQGFDEYPHGLGHQVGRMAHDGGGLLGPKWERYRDLPYKIVETGQVFTLEPRVEVPGYGTVTIEEMVVVREAGAEFISHPQKELWLVE